MNEVQFGNVKLSPKGERVFNRLLNLIDSADKSASAKEANYYTVAIEIDRGYFPRGLSTQEAIAAEMF